MVLLGQLEALEFLTLKTHRLHINLNQNPENKGDVVTTREKPFLATQFVPGEFKTIL